MNTIYGDHMEILCRQGYYTYEYIDNETKLDEIGLPPTSAFYSKLTQKGITEEEYQHALKVYKALGCKTFKD